MQQFFEPVSIDGRRYDFTELTFAQAIAIARIPQIKNEARLTLFLRHVFGDSVDPLKLTAQERYFLLLSYLAQQHTIADGINPLGFLKRAETPFLHSSEPEDGVSVQLMTGRLAEILENHCRDLVDWVTGTLAMQVICPELPPLPKTTDEDAVVIDTFKARCKAIGALPTSAFNRLYATYTRHMANLAVLVHLGVDQHGITLIGGADDAPARFRPSTAFVGSIGWLVRSVDPAS